VETSERDSTVPPTPETFDIEAWVAGVRPNRRSVKLHPQAHVVARLEELAEEIDTAPDGRNVDGMIDEFDRLKAQFNDGVWFTVEQRSTEWIEKCRNDIAARLGVKLEDADRQTSVTIMLQQLAQQVIAPTGVTFQHLQGMFERNEGEVNKLFLAVQQANQQLAETAQVLTRDFSRRRSNGTRG
jgi:ribosomal protein L27